MRTAIEHAPRVLPFHEKPPQTEDRLREKCAVFGVYLTSPHASFVVHRGLAALQHRGQEASGITVSNRENLKTHKGEGLVDSVYHQEDLEQLKGTIAIGHNRYATVGGLTDHTQPITTEQNLVALAHNGTLPQTKKLEVFLSSKHIQTQGLNDSEMMQRAIEYHVQQGLTIEDAIKEAYPLFTGAFSLVVMTKDKLVGIRDSYGIRPLSIGTLGKGEYALSSETVGLDSVGATHLRDVRPGEMVVVDREGMHSEQLTTKTQERLDVFEIVYFARPESRFYGKSVYDMREAMGRQLAREQKIDADMIIGVPNSAIPAAYGYAKESGLPYVPTALLKNSYVHRTFIDSPVGGREASVRRKFSTIQSVLQGRRVVVVDDSIVRGPSAKAIVAMLRQAGAAEVHFLSASPPVKYPDFYGIDTPTQDQLIASKMSVEEIQQFVGADSLHYLSYNGLLQAIGLPEDKLCTSCFTGNYPIDIGDNAESINFSV